MGFTGKVLGGTTTIAANSSATLVSITDTSKRRMILGFEISSNSSTTSVTINVDGNTVTLPIVYLGYSYRLNEHFSRLPFRTISITAQNTNTATVDLKWVFTYLEEE